METFIEPRELVENPHFQIQRQNELNSLDKGMIDSPIIEIIHGFNQLSYCFTLQSCYGHFIYDDQNDIHNLEQLPADNIISYLEYRIAYIAFCVENNSLGKNLIESLKDVTAIDSENIQFCSAEWFWERQVNSYALQVEPERFKCQDTAIIDHREALYIEKLRNRFFVRLCEMLIDIGKM